VGGDRPERLVEVEVDARLGEGGPDPDIQGLGEPGDGVLIMRAAVRILLIADGANEGRPGVGVPKQLGVGLRPEDQDWSFANSVLTASK
jgi:hypothetical protein